MADICTLVMATTTAMACLPQVVCDPAPTDDKTFCRPSLTMEFRDCNRLIAHYECKREDGTVYQFTKQEK